MPDYVAEDGGSRQVPIEQREPLASAGNGEDEGLPEKRRLGEIQEERSEACSCYMHLIKSTHLYPHELLREVSGDPFSYIFAYNLHDFSKNADFHETL